MVLSELSHSLAARASQPGQVIPHSKMLSSPIRYLNGSPEPIRLVLMISVRLPLSLHGADDLLADQGIDICDEPWRHAVKRRWCV